VVQLKSGGPVMTAVKYDNCAMDEGTQMKYLCRWFDGKN
jgi:uncharacterized protein YodC (DUF2158 family)